MTKTQANEPGFTDKLEADSLDAIVEVIGAPRLYNDGKSAMRKWFLNRLRAAAPIVPAPAYGVKEALEPFAKAAMRIENEYGRDIPDGQFQSPAITMGDVRRARTAYDALSSAPVEEAGAKSGSDFVQLPDGWLAIEMKAAEAEIAKWPAGLRASFESLFHAAPPASTIPSEPEAKGEAGAGKVGNDGWQAEAEAQTTALVERAGISLDDHDSFTADLEATLIEFAEWTVKRGPAGAGPVGEAVAFTSRGQLDALKRGSVATMAGKGDEFFDVPLYARPVEEPGEVKRLTSENVNLQTSLNNSVRGHCKTLERAETAEAALADTRERLEKVEAELRYAVMGLDRIHNSLMTNGPKQASGEMTAHFLEHARAALSTQESSAALAGDGKESGR